MIAAPPWAAACMEPAEWAEWQRLNEHTIRYLAHHRDFSAARREQNRRPCLDCPSSFAIEMASALPVSRCNGTPSGDEGDE